MAIRKIASCLNVIYCSAISAGAPMIPRMVWGAYSSRAMCVHDESGRPRSMCLCGQAIRRGVGPPPYFSARLITSAMYPLGRERGRVADQAYPRRSRPPRSTRLRVVVPQCHIMGLPYPPCAFSRAHSTYPMARWGVETNTPYLSILIAGRRLAGESVYSAHDLARTLRGQVCLRRALAARSLRLRGLAIFRGLGPPID